jgi:hypothetical protein
VRQTIRVALSIAIVAAPPALAQTPGETSLSSRAFDLRTAQDLFDVCTTEPSDDRHIAARAFCYGFVSGGQQYHDEISLCLRPIACPDRRLTRDEIVGAFVEYLRQTPEAAEERPINAVFRALSARWPCGKTPPRVK